MPYTYPRQDKTRQDKTRQDKTRQTNYGLLKFGFVKKITSLLVIFSLILTQIFGIFTPLVYAASTPWSQTNWNGGNGQTSWSDTTKFDSSSSVTTSTANQVTLTNTEKLSNTGFESNLTGWDSSAITATGGTITTSGGYTIHTFTSSGTFTPNGAANVEALVVAGGGGGGRYYSGGGGGGGYQSNSALSVTAQAYTVTVGAGGAAGTTATGDFGRDGSDSTFSTITATGGGGGNGSDAGGVNGRNGGSGGGAGGTSSATGGTGSQGFNGGNKTATNGGSGGGGAGAVGAVATQNVGGNGGVGLSNSISGSAVYYAGGGGGSANTVGSGGLGGGGAGATDNIAAVSGTANTGGGGGGGSNPQAAGAGGSGIVIVRYGSLTITRDTTTTYNGSAGSAKLVNGSATQNFTQSVNVGDTNSYNLSTYAYTDGSAVTSSDVELLYNGSTISTTYTSVGSGWYKLTGTLTGANASRTYGVQVKASKTVYVDDFSLNNYASSGTLTSSIFDTEQQSNWGTLTYAATTPSNTSVAVKVRTSNSSSMSGATAFASCSAISSGADISSNACVTDTNQYVQYQLTLANTDLISTPTFTSFSLAFSASIPTAPSSLSGSASGTSSITWSWTDNANNETGFYVQDSLGNTKCTAIANATTCNEGSLSPNTSYTRVVVAYNGSGNSSNSNSASATTRSIPSPSLSSPGNNTYINNSRPSFSFQPSTTNTATSTYTDVASFRLYVKDTTGNTVFSISGIPTSGTTSINNSNYTISFSGFNDSDTGNNYITVQTQSSSSWGNQGKYNTSNDGNLIQGQQTWSVASVDSSGNESASNNTIYLDTTSPTISLTSIGSTPFSTSYQNWYYTQLNPTFTGTSSEQGTVTITLNKKGFNTSIFGGYGIYATATVNTNSSGGYSWTPSTLAYGEYQVIIQSKDQAGNISPQLTFNLIVDTYQNLVNQGIFQGSGTNNQETVEQAEEQGVIQTKEGGPIIPKEPNVLEKAGEGITQTGKNIIQGAGNFITTVFTGIGNGVKFVVNGIGTGLAFVFDKTGQGLAFIFNKTGEGLAFIRNSIGTGYNNIAQHAPGATKNIMLAIGNGFGVIGTGLNNTKNATGNTIANIAFGVGQKTDDVSHSLGTAIIKFGYIFVPEPTKIYDVQVATISPTSAKISWKTNHPANGKVNYGLDETYPFDVQTDKRTNDHEFTLTNLKPNTEYHFEVMSQNRNYVYDANRKFTTPKE